MAIDVTCPQCGEVYEDQDESVLGTDVECECGHVFVAAVPSSSDSPKSKPAGKARPKQKTRRPRPESRDADTRSEERTAPAARNSNGSVSSLVWVMLTIIVGGASAFGALYALGYIPGDKPEPVEHVAGKTQDSTSQKTGRKTKTTPRVAANDRKTTKPVQPREVKTEQKTISKPPIDKGPTKPVDPPNVVGPNNPVDPKPVDPPVTPPDQPNTPNVPQVTRAYKLMEIKPFEAGNPITAALGGVVKEELGKLTEARGVLVKTLDGEIAPLAAAGKLEAIQKLRAAKTKVVATGDASGLADIESDAITAATKVYGESVAASQTRLHAAYTTAITAAREDGNDELNAALTLERDAGFDVGSQTWTVVFRSADPGRWNTAHTDGRNMSIPVVAVSKDIKSLRLRRMDTGATVVIPMKKEWLSEKHLDETAKIGWESKNSEYWKSKKLGIFRADVELRNTPPGTVYVSSTNFGRGYDGWGFGHTNNRFNEPQGYCWGGQILSRTVFEIAVSELAVDEVAPFALRGDAPDAPKPKPTEIPDDSPIAAQLEIDKTQHKAAIETAREKVFAAMDETLKELGEKGDVSGIEKLAAARKEFELHGRVESPSSKLRTKLVSFQSEIGRADLTLQKAYTRAAAAFKREENEDAANLLEEQIEMGVGYEAERWTVLFRSPNPQLWNTHSRGQYQFSRPVSEAPDDLKYLRMRVVTKPRDKAKLSDVICVMTKARLTEQSDVNGIGWNGTKRLDRNAVHLGIYRLDMMIKWPHPDKARGLVSIWSKGFDGHLGWGFGNHIKVDKVQGFAWEGATSTQPLLIEIAVSSKPLRDHEERVLLGSAR